VLLATEGHSDAKVVWALWTRIAGDRDEACGAEPGEAWLPLRRARDLAHARGFRRQGKFDGVPGAHDARLAAAVLFLLHGPGNEARLDALLFIRDLDDQPSRKLGFQQALDASPRASERTIVAGWPREAMEAWVLCAWAPGERGAAALRDVRRTLGYDPCLHPERMPHGRTAKEVIARLLESTAETVEQLFESAEIEALSERGATCGLSELIRSIQRVAVDDPPEPPVPPQYRQAGPSTRKNST
jgi:hypothetical protein